MYNISESRIQITGGNTISDSQGDSPCSPSSAIKLISLISIGLAVIIAYLSISMIYISLQNNSEIELRMIKIEEKHFDLEEEMRPDSAEMNADLAKDLTQNGLHPRKVSQILFLSGFLALAAGFLQFLSSLILHFNFHDEDKDTVQFWSAISIAVFLCLVSCLILLLCLDTAQVPYYAHEIIFISFVTVDVLFSMYSMWIILSTV